MKKKDDKTAELKEQGNQPVTAENEYEMESADEAAIRAAKELDRESNVREFTGNRGKLVAGLLIIYAIYALLINTLINLPIQIHRASFIGVSVIMCFILFPAKKSQRTLGRVPWYDLLLGVVGGGCFFYWIADFRNIISRSGANSELDLIIAIVGILILMEACRRSVGFPILCIVGVFLLYAYFGNYIPGTLGHRGFPVQRIASHLFYTMEGVIGTPLGVCSTFIVLFILFGSFLEKTGVGKFFIDIANSIAGKATGGPAKAAVIASALEGTISGSSVANTVGSGSFTIPMMKKMGYRPEFAAAVEAAASTGGQIMPPVMGAAAFLMSEITGIPYSDLIIAALLPAALYFTGVFLMVHFEAKKLGLKGMSKEEIPHFGRLMLTKGYLLLPLVVLVLMLGNGFTPTLAALAAMGSSIIVSLFRKETRIDLKGFFSALESGARSTIGIAIACSIAGIIVGIVTLTGVGLKLATGLLALSGGNIIIALFFTMIASIVLGMGVPTTANYVIMATITAPIVINLGVDLLPAHMFVFYFGIIADITPPVALAAYAGSAIAKSNPFKTGVTASKLAITAFIVPYVFALNPSLLLLNTPILDVVLVVCTSLIGMYGISAGMEGYMSTHMEWWERLLVIPAGLLLIIPGIVTDAIGIAIIAVVVVIQSAKVKKAKI